MTSYRPIFLLSPPAKILESIMLARIQESIVLEEHQNGFRKGQSTATALQQITDHIKTGLKKKKPMDRTIMSVKSVRHRWSLQGPKNICPTAQTVRQASLRICCADVVSMDHSWYPDHWEGPEGVSGFQGSRLHPMRGSSRSLDSSLSRTGWHSLTSSKHLKSFAVLMMCQRHLVWPDRRQS